MPAHRTYVGVTEMEKLYLSWSSLVLTGFRKGKQVSISINGSIVFCGMGGSGVAGDMASVALEEHGVRSFSVKDLKLPRWVNSNDLVVAISYSGNTVETISCFRDALKRNTKLVVVSSGGRLGDLATGRGIPLVRLSGGYYPRTALAEMVMAVLGIAADSVGLGDDIVVEVSDRLSKVDPGTAKSMAKALSRVDYISVVACRGMGVVARRLRSELAENSKVLARDEVYPEAGHNDIVSWQDDGIEAGSVFVGWSEDGVCSSILKDVYPVYSSKGPAVWIESDSSSLLGAILESSLLGGLMSVYLAGERGVDPRDTRAITTYKEALKRLGGSVG